ncbi:MULTISPECIES: hypothetical protein [unclassified Janthinobacterium]|uniref:hypothetical protein n=1 Tax=unclassified Janthinobacterium TaxID=2610881 RepID=UPI00034A04A2|nr:MULTISPECIES: hypothetical protein [unclassified Janthinobacterium]MEC5159042.1 hypothetical protein [Janthinobacterium sp. CG_S6]
MQLSGCGVELSKPPAQAERSGHLERFILGYARLAKLPAPRPEARTALANRVGGGLTVSLILPVLM